jgi:hypothetical protein
VPMVSPSSMRSTAGIRASDALLYAFDLRELNGRGPAAIAAGRAQGEAGEAIGAGCRRHRVHRDTDEDGATVFWHPCKLGLEGIVSAAYRALQVRAVTGLDQGQESRQPSDVEAPGGALGVAACPARP